MCSSGGQEGVIGICLSAYIDFTAYTLPMGKGGGHRDLPKFIYQKEVLHSGCCIRSVL